MGKVLATLAIVAVGVLVKILAQDDSESWTTKDGTIIEKDEEGTWFTDDRGTRGPY